MVEHVLHSGWLVSFDKHAHTCDSDDAASLANLFNRFVRLETRVTGNQSTAIRVCNQNRFLRNLECVQCGAIPTVRHVNSYARFVQAFDDGDAEVGDTFVSSFS
jgi:hypothetical protein